MESRQVSPAILLTAIFLFQAVLSATSSAVVVGTVFCDTCLQHKFSETSSYFIRGASVAVECSVNRKMTSSISVKGKTDEYGEFRLAMPSMFHSLEKCSVQMLSSPEGSCNIPSITTSSPSNSKRNINLEGDGTYNAGFFSYRPLNVPPMCYKSSPFNYLRLRGRAALEGGSRTAPSLIPNLPQFNFPPLPVSFPFTPPTIGGSPSFPLPQSPSFPLIFPSPPPAKEDEPSKANAESAVAAPTASTSPRPALTFPLIPSIPIPLAGAPPFPSLFPPIPFLNLSPPPSSAKHQTP